MPVDKKVWKGAEVISGLDSQALNGTTEVFGGNVNLEGYDEAACILDVAFNAAGTQDVTVSIYASLDGTYNGNEVAIATHTVTASAGNTVKQPFKVSGYPSFRVGVVHAGAEANNATATLNLNKSTKREFI
jgi:hypothetical protein